MVSVWLRGKNGRIGGRVNKNFRVSKLDFLNVDFRRLPAEIFPDESGGFLRTLSGLVGLGVFNPPARVLQALVRVKTPVPVSAPKSPVGCSVRLEPGLGFRAKGNDELGGSLIFVFHEFGRLEGWEGD